MIKQRIEQDLKQAMLARDKQRVSALRNIKNAINYGEVATVNKGEDLGDEKIIAILQKEAKKRQEAAELYKKANANDRAESEAFEEEVIKEYLPEPLSDKEVRDLIAQARKDSDDDINMGRIISNVKDRAKGRADGGQIARLVKEQIK